MPAVRNDVGVIIRVFGLLLAVVLDDDQARDLRHRHGQIDLATPVLMLPQPRYLRAFHADQRRNAPAGKREPRRPRRTDYTIPQVTGECTMSTPPQQ